jgi:hypothetical protein
VACVVAFRHGAQVGNLLFELAGHCPGVPSATIRIIPLC